MFQDSIPIVFINTDLLDDKTKINLHDNNESMRFLKQFTGDHLLKRLANGSKKSF